MPKRKLPFEECCNYMRQLKMHIGTSQLDDMKCIPSAVVLEPALNSKPADYPNKIQLQLNFLGQLSRSGDNSFQMESQPFVNATCLFCHRINASHSCNFCEKLACSSCLQQCALCNEEFCVLCSVKVYRTKEDVTVCLTCS